MQNILKKGKNYLKVDVSYLSSFVDGTQYDIVLNKANCQQVKVVATGKECGNYVMLSFEFKGCLDKGGIWVIDIFEKDTQNLLKKLRVIVSGN